MSQIELPDGRVLAFVGVPGGGLQPAEAQRHATAVVRALRPELLPSDVIAVTQSPTRPIVASVEYGNTRTQTDQLIVEPRGANPLCPDNTFEVHTYRNGVDADDVSFTLIVP